MSISDPTLGIAFPTSKLRSAQAQSAVTVNPQVWSNYPAMADAELPRSILRSDLTDLATATDWDSDAQIRRLFVMTMAWGSGTTNGRGPRYTQAALSSETSALEALRDARELVRDGKIAEAYECAERIHGVGPPFLTKWLWVVGTTLTTFPTPLILDSRVWKGLGDLGWDSRRAANSRRWGERYVAYLNACAVWAERSREAVPSGVHPEDIEYSLFMWDQ